MLSVLIMTLKNDNDNSDEGYQFALCDTEDNPVLEPFHSHKCIGSSLSATS